MTYIDRSDYITPPPKSLTCRVDYNSPCEDKKCPDNCPVLQRIRQTPAFIKVASQTATVETKPAEK